MAIPAFLDTCSGPIVGGVEDSQPMKEHPKVAVDFQLVNAKW